MLKKSHPFLHELFKACIHYKAKEVIETLKAYYRWKIFHEWEFVESRQEVRHLKIIRAGFKMKYKLGTQADVIWKMRRVNRVGSTIYMLVIHEIKTGRFDINEIWEKYREIQGSRILLKREDKKGVANRVLVWGWKDEILRQKINPKLENSIMIKMIPLEYILSIMLKELAEIGFVLEE